MKPGQIVADRYEVRGLLGRGGMGEVYLAHDRRLATEVALKRVPLALALETTVRAALIKEARVLARLSHTHIVRLFDLADTVDGLFLVLEYVCGPSLDVVLARRPKLSLDEVIQLMSQTVDGLSVAHAQGVIHRDLKPSNLLVALHGDEQRRYLRDGTLPASLINAHVKVSDFGLAKVVRDLTRPDASATVVGTPAYMAPEQLRGEAPSAETDVYALGLIAYECLAGRRPMGTAEPLYFHLFVTPPPLPNVPPHVDAAVQKALSKERAGRFRSADAFARALREPAAPGPGPKRSPRHQTTSTGVPRHVVGTAVAVGLAVVLSIVVFPWLRSWPVGPRSTASPKPSASSGLTIAPLPIVNPPPRITSLPPVIDRARLPQERERGLPPGIERPTVLAAAAVPGQYVIAFGPEGTTYVRDSDNAVAAVQAGQVRWLYDLDAIGLKFGLARDGLLWASSTIQGPRVFCFNVAGQGGELTPSARGGVGPVPELRGEDAEDDRVARCLEPDEKREEPAVEGVAEPGRRPWRVALDHRCKGEPATGPGGHVVVQTQGRTLYSIGGDGRIHWTLSLPCLLDTMRVLDDGGAVGVCSGGKRLIGIQQGRLSFSREFESILHRAPTADRDGNLYVAVRLGEVMEYSVLKLNRAGNTLWSLLLPRVHVTEMAMSPAGELLVFGFLLGGKGRALLTVGEAAPGAR